MTIDLDHNPGALVPASMATVTTDAGLVGVVVTEPEFLTSPSGIPRTRFMLAVRPFVYGAAVQPEGMACYSVVCYRSLASDVYETVTKGCRVVVSGRLGEYVQQREGGDRSVLKVVAYGVGLDLRRHAA